MRRLGSALAAGALALTGLVACSSDDAYCSALKDEQGGLEDAGTNGSEDVGAAIDAMRQVADVAPDDLQDEWATTVDFLERYEKVKDDQDKVLKLVKDLGPYESALKTVTNDAQKRCGIELEPGTG